MNKTNIAGFGMRGLQCIQSFEDKDGSTYVSAKGEDEILTKLQAAFIVAGFNRTN